MERIRATRSQQIKTLCKKDFLLFKREKKMLYLEVFTFSYILFVYTIMPSMTNNAIDNNNFIVPKSILASSYSDISKGLGNLEYIDPQRDNIRIGVAPCVSDNIVANRLQKTLNKILGNVTCYQSVDEMHKMQQKAGVPDYRILINIPLETNFINEQTTTVPYNISLNSVSFSSIVNNVPYDGALGRPTGFNYWITSGLVNLMYLIELEITKHYKITKMLPEKVMIGEGPYNAFPEMNSPSVNILSSPISFLVPIIFSTLRLTNEKKLKLWDHIIGSTGVSGTTLALSFVSFHSIHITVFSMIIGYAMSFVLTNVALPLLITFFILVGLTLNLWKVFLVVLIKNTTYTLASLTLLYLLCFGASFGLRIYLFKISEPDALKCLTFLTPQATMIEGILQMKEFAENPSVTELNFNNLNYVPSGKNKLTLTECFIGLLFQVPFYLGLIIYTINTMSGNGTNTKPACYCFRQNNDNSNGVEKRQKKSRSNSSLSMPLVTTSTQSEANYFAVDVEEDRNDNIEATSSNNVNVGIDIVNLKKTYKSRNSEKPNEVVKAVDGLSVKFYQGEITALLGHNGAGKTTTMQMLTGAIKPTDGDAKILGESISTNMGNVKKYVGLCPQHNVLWDQLTV
jgi:hypothetical protein